MLKYFLIFSLAFLTGFPAIIKTQTISGYQMKIDSLQQVETHLRKRLETLESLEKQYQRKITQLSFVNQKHTQLISTRKKGYVMSKPDPISDIISTIPPHTSLIAMNFTGRYWKVSYNETIGYISDFFIESKHGQKKFFLNMTKNRLQSLHQYLQTIIRDTLYVKDIQIRVYSKPNLDHFAHRTFQKGKVLYAQDESNNWYHILYNSPSDEILANISFENADSSEVLLNLFAQGWVQKSAVQKEYVQHLTPSQKRRELYVKNHPGIAWKFKVTIQSGSIMIGMTKDMVRASLGEPDDVNRTVYSFGVHEQWIYGGISNRKYLYFEDGTLKSWQD